MTEIRRWLEDLADRGEPVGPDVVYARAAAAAYAPNERPTRRPPILRALVAAACILVSVGAIALLLVADGHHRRVVVDPHAAKPRRGGSVVYAVESETAGGWCLYQAQLTAAGIQVATAIYDTLTLPGADGNVHPFLADSVTPNQAATVWTITLRPHIQFSDGSPLDAQVVKDNLDAYVHRSSTFARVFADVKSVTVVDDLALEVTLWKPWQAFPWQLWSYGRLGIMGEPQLRDSRTCSTNMVGTGPFMKQSWTPDRSFVAVRNPHYWRMDAWGQSLPYLDQITFVPQEDAPTRLHDLEAGEATIAHTTSPKEIAQIRDDVRAGKLGAQESEQFAEVSFTMLNATRAPFDQLSARRAVAYAIDRDELNKKLNDGLLTNASGPFAPGSIGYLPDAGYPTANAAKARTYAEQYKVETGADLTFSITHTSDSEATSTARLLRQMLERVGIRVELVAISDESSFVNAAITKSYDAILWRNYPGGDPDMQYTWWHCTNPPPASCDNTLNFSGFNDADINRDLEDGRTNPNPSARRMDYERINERFAEQLWNLWDQWSHWTVAYQPYVNGLLGPNLPDGAAPSTSLTTGHSLAGIWVTK